MRSPAPPGEITDLCDALLSSGAALADLMREIRDPAPTAVGVWSIGEAAAHVAGSAEYFLAAVLGRTTRERLDELGSTAADGLAQDPQRDPAVLSDRLVRGESALVGHARHVDGDPDVEPFEGVVVPLSSVLAIELGEVLVHGFDMARAARLPWTIPPDGAVLALRGYLPLIPHLVDRSRSQGVRIAVELRIRGMDPVVVRVRDGVASVQPPEGQRVDAHVVADPVSYLLLMWNRVPPWQPMLRGHLVVWGRRPWSATALGRVFVT
jgi:uncharacterized protein (TIGR03083 family)